jgi:cellulose biosynthesis protein BcsQ
VAARVICMASAKGGSGKTVITATFGTFLVALNKRVLLIDTDAATNGLSLLFLKEVMMRGELALSEGRKPRGIYEVTAADHKVEIVELSSKVHLIPATYGFINTEGKSLPLYEEAIKKVIAELRESYDFIFLDAQAGSDPYAYTAIKRGVSDEVVIVSEYDPMSAAGVERLKGLFREDLTYVRTWVLLNKMLPDFVKSFNDFLEVAKYLSPLPWDADVVKAYARRRVPLDLEEGNEHTLAVMQALKSLIGDEIAGELNAWARKKADIIRRPIIDQFREIDKEFEQLYMARNRLRQKKFVRWMAPAGLLMTGRIRFSGPLLFVARFR